MSSVIACINRYKATWKNRYEVNSTIQELHKKISVLRASRNKEMRKCNSSTERNSVSKRYDNDIMFYDAVLYQIHFNYYEIVGNFSNVQ